MKSSSLSSWIEIDKIYSMQARFLRRAQQANRRKNWYFDEFASAHTQWKKLLTSLGCHIE